MKDQTITMEAVLRQVIDQLDGPTSLDEVVQRVLAIRPSQARNPAQQVRNDIRQLYRPTWVWLDQRTLLPMRLCMRGVRFRITPSQPEVERNLFFAALALHGFHPGSLPLAAVQLIDAKGEALACELATVEERRQSPFGEYTAQSTGLRLNAWFAQVGFRPGDSILATVIDWEAGRFQFEHEPASQRRPDEIARKNQELADLLYAVLEEASRESVFDVIAVPTAYARMAEPAGYPGDHWVEVLRHDPRMVWMGYEIRYADFISPDEAELFGKPLLALATRPRAAQQGQVYRFKAALKHRPGLWRQIDIQGKQTLAEFDRALRSAFAHDWDHMSGFWKKVRRGQSKRFREVDLGSIDTFGEGDGAEVQVAALGLQPGDQLKYVYDFGDWIEHTLTLEEIVEPEAGIAYPRLVAQNKPRYSYCERCRQQGRETVAIYICIDCSDRQQRDVLLCDRCASEEHEDHYVDELVY